MKGTGGKLTGESLYDSRLFNQSAGMDAGFGNEDEYNTYSKPLFDRDGNKGGTSIYRPKKNDDDIYGDGYHLVILINPYQLKLECIHHSH